MGRPTSWAPPLRCDMCDRPLSDSPTAPLKILRFYLTTRSKTKDGRPSSRGAGVIDLCGRCWLGLRNIHRKVR